MNKNLLRVIVYGAYLLIVVGLFLLMDQIIPSQTYKTFTTTMGIVRFIIVFLIMLLSITGVNFILRKYGAQITPITSPKKRTVLIIIIVVLLVIGFFIPLLFK